jgi:hypothetical protein
MLGELLAVVVADNTVGSFFFELTRVAGSDGFWSSGRR